MIFSFSGKVNLLKLFVIICCLAVTVLEAQERRNRRENQIKPGEPLLRPGSEGREYLGKLKGSSSRGKPIYAKYCAYCHGKQGLGNGMAAVALNPKPANFITLKTYQKKSRELFQIITYGKRGSYQLDMPAWGPTLSQQERADVIAYIKKLARTGRADN